MLAGLGLAAGVPSVWMSRMKTYDGPVSDHFDGLQFFDPDGVPPRSLGQVLRWRVQFIAVQKGDELRPDIPNGATYLLARGPLPERGFVYVIVPEARVATVSALAPLATIQVTARVRAGRSRYLGNPVVELLALEAVP